MVYFSHIESMCLDLLTIFGMLGYSTKIPLFKIANFTNVVTAPINRGKLDNNFILHI